MNTHKVYEELLLIRNRIHSDFPELSISTVEIVFNGFSYDGGFKNFSPRASSNKMTRLNYVTSPDILLPFINIRETIHAGLSDGILPQKKSLYWLGEYIDRGRLIIERIGNGQIKPDSIELLVTECFDLFMELVASKATYRNTVATLLVCEIFEMIGLPGLVFSVYDRKSVKSSLRKGKNFYGRFLTEVLSAANRALDKLTGEQYSDSISSIKSTRGVQDLYIKPGTSWRIFLEQNKRTWVDSSKIRNFLLFR